MSRLDRFYPIFDSADWLNRLVPRGIRMVQLRVKDRPEDEIRAEITASKRICRTHGCQLIVNDHWRLAIELGCDFVHLGQEDLDGADLDAIRAGGLRLGLSTHDPAELERALSLNPDYVALGPIHGTILKKMKWGKQGVDRITEWKRLAGPTPLVAIGGMTVERAGPAFAAGADIVSAVTDITLNASPEKRVDQWIAATR